MDITDPYSVNELQGLKLPSAPPRVTRNLWKPHKSQSRPPAIEVASALPAMTPLPDSRSLLEIILGGVRNAFSLGTVRASSLYLDAMSVRQAVLFDPNGPAIVRGFAREHLHIKDVTAHVLEALTDVLLADDWRALSGPDDQLRTHLRARTRERHRSYRPIVESRLGQARILSLSTEIVTPVGLLQLDQVLPGTSNTESEALAVGLWEDHRIDSLLVKLNPEGRSVVEMVARFPKTSWPEAAALAGLDPGRGEQIRRQVRYLVRESNRRERLRCQAATAEGKK